MRRITMMIMLAVLLSACGASQSAKPTSELEQAARFAPANFTYLQFTNWALIKKYKGVDLSSASDEQAKMDFMLALTNDQSPAAGFALDRFPTHATAWGWDTLDLVWEATVEHEQGLVYVLRFRDDFDFAPIIKHFEERGFERTEHQGSPMYTHVMDLKQDWTRTTEFAILNTAVLQNEHILVLSSKPDSLKAILDVYRDPTTAAASRADVKATIEQLGETAAAMLSAETGICQKLSARALATADPRMAERMAQIRDQFSNDEPLHAYTIFGVNYRYENTKPVGRFVMQYANAADATADLAARRMAAQEGNSLVTRQPYSQSVFMLESATVQNSAIVLKVNPVDDQPSRLFRGVVQLDLPFAGCP